jgi:transposase
MAQKLSVLGVDIAKLVFHVVGMNDRHEVVLRKRIPRSELLCFIATLPPVLIGMEACGSAHYWARRFREHGHDVRLMAPQFVKASVKSPKHDTRDAEAICQAVTRPTMRFVPVKQLEQQDLQALHRVRERLIETCTALVNGIRRLLNVYGIVLPQNITKFCALIVDKLQEEQAKLTTLSAELFWHLYAEFRALEKRLIYDDEKVAAMGQTYPNASACRPSQGSDRCVPPPSSRQSVTRLSSRTAASWRPGWDWSRENTRQAASRGSSGSAHEGTSTSVHSSHSPTIMLSRVHLGEEI